MIGNASRYLYAVTRRDLPPIYAAVQASHAIFAAAQALHASNSPQPNFATCTAKDEDALRSLCERLEKAGIRFEAWFEPDLDNQLTAIATEPLYGEQRKLFSNLPLLKIAEGTVC